MATATGQAPLSGRQSFVVPAVATATDSTFGLLRMLFASTVTAVKWAPNANYTGANTNYRRLAIINKGTDGNGTTIVAEFVGSSGANALDFDETALTLSATAANLDIAVDSILALESEAVGTGLADPGGVITIEYARN